MRSIGDIDGGPLIGNHAKSRSQAVQERWRHAAGISQVESTIEVEEQAVHRLKILPENFASDVLEDTSLTDYAAVSVRIHGESCPIERVTSGPKKNNPDDEALELSRT